MSPVGRPMHRVDLGQVALERPLCLHQLVSGDGLMGLLSHGAEGGVGQLVLFPLDPVLQRLSLAPRLLNARLHSLRRHISRPLRVHGGRFQRVEEGGEEAGEAG